MLNAVNDLFMFVFVCALVICDFEWHKNIPDDDRRQYPLGGNL